MRHTGENAVKYTVIVTTTYEAEAQHPLLAAKVVRKGKATVAGQDLYVFSDRGAMEFREHGSTKGYAAVKDSLSADQLDEVMANWGKDDALGSV